MAIKVLLADNQPLTAAGLTYLLNQRQDTTVVDNVLERDQLPHLLKKHYPDLLIVDYDAPGFVSSSDLLEVRTHSPSTNVLVVSADNNKASILEVLQAGVTGYLTKVCTTEEIMMAVSSVARGEKFFCHKILDIIMEKHFYPETDPTVGILTSRESEILTLLATGYSTQKVADKLYLSPHTVHTHRKSIIKKLNIKSPTEFVIYALDFGLIKTK
ncbi:MAG TPA: response regulator transcription factor [Chryseolinea sp.]|nr:response regulator transcription factor [Chryseolinea sp.]